MMCTAFEFFIWQPIYHNGKFSHNVSRRLVRRADNYGKFPDISHLLKPRRETMVSDSLTVVAEPEYVTDMRKGKLVVREEFVPAQ